MKSIAVLLFFLIYTNLHSQAWIEQTSGVTVQLTSVSVPQNSFDWAWICGYNGTVLRTTNLGVNWLNVSGNGIPSNVSLVNILGINGNIALTAGYVGTNTYVYLTSNSGANWTQVFFQPNGFINAIVIIGQSTTNFLMQGDPVAGRWSLWTTVNGGTNWDSAGLYLAQAGAEAGWNNSMWSDRFSTSIWFGTNNSRIYYSTTGGLTWVAQSTPAEPNSYAVWFFSQYPGNQGLSGGATLLQTTNSGTNWSGLTSLGSGNFGGISGSQYPVNNPAFQILWYVRSNNNIYKSGDGGQSWQIEHTAPAGNYRHLNGKDPGGPWWAVRTNGGISFHGRIVAIEPISNQIPRSNRLYQNYPNPFNSTTKFCFDITNQHPSLSERSDESFVSVRIYNTIGREVAVLANERLTAGSYKIEWDGSNYPSGIYYYRLSIGNFSEVRKLVLVK